MNKDEAALFSYLRKLVWDYIEEYLKDDCGHKSYEGTWELTVSYPDYFHAESYLDHPEVYVVQLHCYVLGPRRHYQWDGSSWMETLEQAEQDIKQWIREEVEP